MQNNNVTTEKLIDDKQQLEKDRIQKEVAADQAKPKCRICAKYTDKKTSPQCFGHGGGEGGGSSGGSDEQASKDDVDALTNSSSEQDLDSHVEAANVIDDLISLMPQLVTNDLKFDPEIISELLSKRLLNIDNDRDKGILDIKLLCEPGLLSTEQKYELRKYINAILHELNEFKKENNIASDCYKLEKDQGGNILSFRISFPTPALYDAFILRLANKFLLPKQNVDQQHDKKVVYADGVNHFSPTPFSLKPTPEKKIILDNEEAQKASKSQDALNSPFRLKSLLDGLKPKGWL